MLVTGGDEKQILDFKSEMERTFEMSDLGLMNFFLGLEVKQNSSGIFISQKKYALEVLKKFQLEKCKEVLTPLAVNEKVSKDDGILLKNPSKFRSLVGSLLYLTDTRPDFMFSASYLSRFMSTPTDVHFAIGKRILRYIKVLLIMVSGF